MNIKKVLNGIEDHVVDTTGLLLASTPIYAAMETFGSGMSVETSLDSRLKVSVLSYMGLGFIYNKGRDFSKKKLFKINESPHEWKHITHDSAYTVLFNTLISIPIYLNSGADIEQTMKGAAGAVILGIFAGPINGYGVDTFRDFVGTKQSKRLPKKIQTISSRTKKFLAAGLIATTIAATAGIYKLKEMYSDEPIKTEEVSKILDLETRTKSYYSYTDF